jgi:hypothetical protein
MWLSCPVRIPHKEKEGNAEPSSGKNIPFIVQAYFHSLMKTLSSDGA